MFYSHEILTSRKYGVATVWLVATLGAKSSNTKKITRKAILDVDVRKACETIMEPEAPMALRLQSNLLYGLSRVYHQQCGYVLQDAQSAQTAIRSLIKASRSTQLDINAGNARPELLVLLDDPAFLPENALPALDFDFDFPTPGDSQRSTQSLMSIRTRCRSDLAHSTPDPSVLGLNLPSSSRNSAYRLPDLDGFGEITAHKNYAGLGRELDEEELLDNDNIFGFNEDGELLDLPVADRDALRSDAILGGAHRQSDSAASRVRKEHEDGFGAPLPIGDEDVFMPYADDVMGVLPDAEPFGVGDLPLMTGGLGGDDRPQRHSSQDLVFSEEEEEESSISAQAPQRRKPAVKKNLVVDSQLEIRNGDMKAWQTGYLARMAASSLVKEQHKANAQAKKNAFHFVLGGGLNGVGSVGSSTVPSPLVLFAGESLLALITGRAPAPDKAKRGKKRLSEENVPSPPAKRSRDSELGRAASPSNNINILEDDAGIINNDDDQSQYIELGRKADSALPDHPSSALMPWNKSASLNSHQRNASSQHGRRAGILGGHRLASASPLIGRGSNLPIDMDQFLPMHGEDDGLMGSRADDGFGNAVLDFGAGGGMPSSSHGRGAGFHSPRISYSNMEFEVFGQAANVDNQTAATSQWVRDALDKESSNFFEYVRNTIEEKQSDEFAEPVAGDEHKWVTFDELFNSESNSAVVAAQAFYHVLCLATKQRVWVEQDEIRDEDDAPVPFGEIKIGVVDVAV